MAAVSMFMGSAHAALIGTALMTAPNPAKKIRELGWTPKA